jgi:integrase/recombinase XerD
MKVHIPQLPYDRWPASDKRAWDDLFRDGNVLDGAGPARHWAPATRKTNGKHYAQWLGWLEFHGLLDDCADPWRRASPDRISAYARELMEGRAPRTVASSAIGLKCVLIRMAPEEDWRWLRDLTNRFDAWAPSARESDMPALTARHLFRAAIAYLERNTGISFAKAADRKAYRDTLMIALLIACPIRVRNLAMMEVARHLTWQGDDWHLRFGTEETKTSQPIHLILPSALNSPLNTYINEVRLKYRRASESRRLWMGAKQAPLAENTIYQNLMHQTRIVFGEAINPHAFRTIAATFFAETSPADALRARPLLGHRDAKTTERHYISANQIEASRKVSKAIEEIRRGSRQ